MFLPWQLETKTIHFNICKLNIKNSTRFTLTYLLRLDLLLHYDYVTSVDQETLINFLGVVKRLQWQKRRRGEKKRGVCILPGRRLLWNFILFSFLPFQRQCVAWNKNQLTTLIEMWVFILRKVRSITSHKTCSAVREYRSRFTRSQNNFFPVTFIGHYLGFAVTQLIRWHIKFMLFPA